MEKNNIIDANIVQRKYMLTNILKGKKSDNVKGDQNDKGRFLINSTHYVRLELDGFVIVFYYCFYFCVCFDK